jgi:sugar phosphate permease
VFVGFAMLFTGLDNPVVELGLGIAGFTYGGLLGAFLLGLISRRAREADAMIAFAVTIAAMVLLIFGLWWGPEVGWVADWRPTPETRAALGLRAVAWPLYPVIGSALTVGLGMLLGMRHPGADPPGGRPTSL